jgi:hypothetical protein
MESDFVNRNAHFTSFYSMALIALRCASTIIVKTDGRPIKIRGVALILKAIIIPTFALME